MVTPAVLALEKAGLPFRVVEYDHDPAAESYGDEFIPWRVIEGAFVRSRPGGDIVCQVDEIAEARWFAVDDLPNVPPPTAISRWLIDDFVRARSAAR